MAKEGIRLPRSSYEELAKIIVAYEKADAPSGLDDISATAAIGRTVVSANNGFLAAIGVIEGGRLKSATAAGTLLAQALEYEVSQDIEKAWTSIIEGSEFLSKMLQAVTIRRGMERSQLETHIAYSAGERKTKNVMTGARCVVDILRASGLVIEEDGRIISSTAEPPPEILTAASVGTRVVESALVEGAQLPSPPPVTVHIEVRINATPSELDGLGSKIKALIASLKEVNPEDAPSSTAGS